MVFIMYQLLTEHVRRFKRWGNLKVYAILNAIEIVTWAAVAFMVIQANTRYCVGTNCILAWIIVVLAIIQRYVGMSSLWPCRSRY